jgi:crotonobetaine/carnitine-CoA ligase
MRTQSAMLILAARRSVDTMLVPLLPYDGFDMRSLIQAQAARHGKRVFLVWEPFESAAKTWSYSEFFEAVRGFAAGLHARGLGPGDRLLINLDNCPEFLVAWLGCAWAGVVGVTSNTKLSLDELTYVAAHSVPRKFALSKSFRAQPWRRCQKLNSEEC